MPTLNPTLGGGIGYEQPVTPVGSALGGLAELGSGILAGLPGPKAPSADDRKGAILQPFAQRIDEIMNSSDMSDTQKQRTVRGLLGKQLTATPQYRTDIFGITEGYGVTTPVLETPPEDARSEAMNAFLATPHGQIIDARARNAATAEDGSFDEEVYQTTKLEGFAEQQQFEAQVTRLAKESQMVDNKRNIDSALWDYYKPKANGLIADISRDVYKLAENVRTTGKAEISEEMAESLGIPAGNITVDNFVPYLKQYRNTLKRQIRSSLVQETGKTSLTPADEKWYNDVLLPIDAIISAAEEDFGSIANIRKTFEDQEALKGMRAVSENHPRLWAEIQFGKLLPPEMQTQFAQNLWTRESLPMDISKGIMTMMGSNASVETLKTSINETSTNDAKDIHKTSGEILRSGSAQGQTLKNSFTAFFHSQARTGDGDTYLSGNAFDSIVTTNAKRLQEEMSADPEFANNVAATVLRDISSTLQATQNEIDGKYPWASVSIVNGKVELTVTGDTRSIVESRGPMANVASVVEETRKAIENSPSYKLVQKKISGVDTLGNVSGSIIGALELQNPPKTVTGEGGEDTNEGSQGNDTLGITSTAQSATSLLRKFEGFRETAYWDVNAYRTGFGSDTITKEDGTIVKVTKDTVVTRADAERDLIRRSKEFASTAASQVGKSVWSNLPTNVTAALTSVAYNYGSLPKRILSAVKSGDASKIAAAVEGLADDNDGINRSRRMQEAAVIRGDMPVDPNAAPVFTSIRDGQQEVAQAVSQFTPEAPQASSGGGGTQRTQEAPKGPSTGSEDIATVRADFEKRLARAQNRDEEIAVLIEQTKKFLEMLGERA